MGVEQYKMEPLRILVIDDDVRHAASVRDLLASSDYTVSIENDSEAGLQRLESGDVDILLLDINMPGITGIDILRRVAPERRGIKTIVLSGETDVAHLTPILRLGAYDYLPKPYAPAQLLASVRNAEIRLQLERENQHIQAERDATSRRHAFLINASPDLIFVLDRDGNFTFINNKLKDIFNYDADSLIGRHWSELLEPSLRAPLERHMTERRTGERATRHLEFDYRDPEGRMHVIELSAMGIYDSIGGEHVFTGTYGVVRDMTAPRKTSRVLAQSQQKFYGLFMNSPDAVFISRLDDGTLIEGNDNFAGMMAEIDRDGAATDLALWGKSSARDAFIRDLKRSPSRHQATLERVLDHGSRFFEITARKLDLDGAECMMASLKDLTAQRQAELDRLNLETQLQQASKMEAIGQLAGGIAHDFNNILASIIGYTELALVSLPDDSNGVDNYLNEVVSAGQRARDLISQMLTFTRAHRGDAELTSIEGNMAEVSRMLRAAIPKTIDIDTEFADDLPDILVDPVQLQQIVINLLINARDAIKGQGRIAVSAKSGHHSGNCISCTSEYDGDYVALSVADSGHGIPDHMLKRVFDMFVSTREPGSGTGIGLWLIHTIVHEYDGHIRLVSSDSGTRFDILFPTSPAQDRPEVQAPVRPKEQKVNCNGHIVVIDDEVSVANFISQVLGNAGYEVVTFNDSNAARSHIIQSAAEIALVLTDQSMPQVTGIEIAETAREQQPGLPVVIITGYADKSDAGKLNQLGVAHQLDKPFRIEVLLKVVRDNVRRDAVTVE